LFTGLVEETGRVISLDPAGRLTLEASTVLEGTAVGDSIAVSGICLTVVEMTPGSFTVDVMPETLARSTLGTMKRADPVNLERAIPAGGRLGGHIVNGHIDGVGTVRLRREQGNAVVFEVGVEGGLEKYMAPKGSVAVDGVSLTVVGADRGAFRVSVIPHTLAGTTLERARPGTRVNIEVDVLAKYVEAFLARSGGGDGLRGALERGGYLEGE
jgi:riboflavin synthase